MPANKVWRNPVRVLSTETTFQTGSSPSIVIDGVVLVNNNRILFTNLTDSSKRNKVYKVTNIASSGGVKFTLETDGGASGNPVDGHVMYIQEGGVFHDLVYAYNGTSWGLLAGTSALEMDPLAIRKDNSNPPTVDISFDSHKITSLANGTASSDAVNKSQLDNKADNSAVIKKDGSVAFTADESMGGFKLTSLANGSAASDAVNKGQMDAANSTQDSTIALKAATTYVDSQNSAQDTVITSKASTSYVNSQDALKVSKSGDTMSGALNMGANLINSVADPVAAQDAATKAYVDALLQESTSASNLGSGTGVFASEVADDLQFKSLLAGSHMSLASTANDITMSVDPLAVFRYLAGNLSVYGGTNSTLSFTGVGNSLIGVSSGNSLTSGQWNNFLGYLAGTGTTTGSFNVGIGGATLLLNSAGDYNIAIGHGAMFSGTTASQNIAIGFVSGLSLSSGASNVMVGFASGQNLTVGSSNTLIGNNTGNSMTSGQANACVGASAGLAVSTGSANAFFGNNAGIQVTTGNDNIAIGFNSLFSNLSGNQNIAIGSESGRNETGSNSFYLNNVAQASLSDDRAYSLMYGNFSGVAGSTAGQTLQINAEVTASGQLRAASLGVGNSAAATTPGSVVKKIEVFDASGASLGFVAVYNSIS